MSKIVYSRLKRLGRGMKRLVSGGSRLEALQLECRLEHILSGATCAPISLQDFENYLANQELSIENLQFVVWFMDYRARFMRLPLSVQQTSPDPAILRPWDVPPSSPLPVFEPNSDSDTTNNAIRGWFDAVVKRRQAASKTEGGDIGGAVPPASKYTATRHPARPTPAALGPAFKDLRNLPLSSPPGLSPSLTKSTSSGVNLPNTPRTPDSGVPLLLTPTASISGALASPPFPLTPNSPPGVQVPQQGITLSEQPFRDEALAVVATFMRAGGTGKKELNIDERLRKQVMEDLAYTTHPNIFAKVYQSTFRQLEVSARNFLALQSSNINIGKQLYWYSVGFVFTFIGFTLSIILIIFVPAYHHNPAQDDGSLDYQFWKPFPIRRGARLAGMPFATAGACQLYNAYIGFCSEVFGRGSTQLKSWELDDPEEVGVEWRETGHPSTSKKGAGADGGSNDREEAFELQDPPTSKKKKQDLEAIAPFDLDIVPSLSVASSGGGSRSDPIQPNDAAEDSSTAIILDPNTFNSPRPTHEVAFVDPKLRSSEARYTRPPVFGPERVVLDERIRQYHLDVLHDTFMVAIWYCLIYAAVVLAIPSPKP